MKYFNIKRYKFSTITRRLGNLVFNILDFVKIINFKKIYNYLDYISTTSKKTFKYLNPKKTFKYLDPRKYNIFNIINKIKIRPNRFLSLHLPGFIVFFAFLYFLIPTFYNYDKTKIKKFICTNNSIACIINGKISYNFFPTPRLKIKDLTIKTSSNNKKILNTNDVSLKLSIKNLLAKDKHKIKNIVLNNFESYINLRKLKNYNNVLERKINSIPIFFTKGKFILSDGKDYVASITDANLIVKLLKDSSEAKLKGKFLNDDIVINFDNKIENNKPNTKIELRMKNFNLHTKIDFFSLNQNINNGKFLIKKNKNKIVGIFDYENNEITINKSSIRNSFIDGKLIGNIVFLPYFDFNLDLNLNSINFTRLYNYFLSLTIEEQKKIFKINNKVNGKLNFSSEKIYSKNNLIKSFESRMKFYNGNVKIEQFLINLGKLGAADILGKIDNNEDSSNFKFESNIFVDNNKKFFSKFGIYDKKTKLSNLYVQGNFDLQNIKAHFYDISSEKKFKIEEINFIESEFNDFMLENDFENLFNFQKFKVFLKSARSSAN